MNSSHTKAYIGINVTIISSKNEGKHGKIIGASNGYYDIQTPTGQLLKSRRKNFIESQKLLGQCVGVVGGDNYGKVGVVVSVVVSDDNWLYTIRTTDGIFFETTVNYLVMLKHHEMLIPALILSDLF